MFRTVILLGERAGEFAAAMRRNLPQMLVAAQDLAPAHVNCVRILMFEDPRVPSPLSALIMGALKMGVHVLHDDYTTYGMPNFGLA